MTERLQPASESPIVFSREADGVHRNNEGVAFTDWRAQQSVETPSQPQMPDEQSGKVY